MGVDRPVFDVEFEMFEEIKPLSQEKKIEFENNESMKDEILKKVFFQMQDREQKNCWFLQLSRFFHFHYLSSLPAEWKS